MLSLLLSLLILLTIILSSSSISFGRHSTAKQVVDYYADENKIPVNKFLKGKTYVVTGGNAGIGLETCKVFAYAGARVIMCSRSVQAGYDAIEKEIVKSGHGKYEVKDTSNIIVKELDLSSIASIKKFAKDIKKTEKSIDAIIFNAGIMSLPNLIRTKDLNIEKQMAVNHIGHAMLSRLLVPVLKRQGKKSRVIFLSSSAHKIGNKDLMKEVVSNSNNYVPWIAYGQSKLANLLYAKGLAKNLKETGYSKINSFSVHPGVITSTQLFNQSILAKIVGLFPGDRNMAQGAASTVWSSLAPELDECRGEYIFDCHGKVPNSNGLNPQLRDEVWKVTEDILDKHI